MKDFDHHNDWIYTAYVLGELSPEAHRSVEERLRLDPLLAARVAGLRATLDAARSAFAGEVDTTTQMPQQKLLARLRDTRAERAAAAVIPAPVTPAPAQRPSRRRGEVRLRRSVGADPRRSPGRTIGLVLIVVLLSGIAGVVGYLLGRVEAHPVVVITPPATPTSEAGPPARPPEPVAAPAQPASVVAPIAPVAASAPAPEPPVATPVPAPGPAKPAATPAPEPTATRTPPWPSPTIAAPAKPEDAPSRPRPIVRDEPTTTRAPTPTLTTTTRDTRHDDTPPLAASTIAPRTGELLVTATPWAKASINGRPYGSVPLKVRLPVGIHTVTLMKGDRTFTSSITVEPGALAIVSRDFD